MIPSQNLQTLAPGAGRVARFAGFVLDVDARRLTRDGQEIVLPPRVFDLLLALVDAPGVLLTRERLLAQVWSDTVVADSSLTQAVSVLRRELESGGEDLIRTIPRVGYRFEAAVETARRDGAQPAVDAAPDPVPRRAGPAAPHATRFARALAGLAAVVVAVAAVAAWRERADAGARAPATAADTAEALDAYTEGVALEAQHQLHPAQERLQAAVERQPDFAAAHLALADVLDQRGQRARARVHVESALRLPDALAPAARQEAQALARELDGDWSAACALRERATAAPSAPVDATLRLARCLIHDGRAHRARELLGKALPALHGEDRLAAMLLEADALLAIARYGPGADRAAEVVADATTLRAPALRARALVLEGEGRLLAGDLESARRAIGEAAQALRALGDAGAAIAAEQKVVVRDLIPRDPPAAERLLREHLAEAEVLGDPVLAAHSLRLLSAALKGQGRLGESRETLERAHAAFVELGDRGWQARLDINLAIRDELLGAFDRAEARLRDALANFPEHGIERWFAQNELSYVLRHRGRYAEAVAAADAALEAAGDAQGASRRLQVQCERAWSLLHLGRSAEAARDFRACRRFADDAALERKPALAAYAALGLALLEAADGRLASAHAMWSEAVHHLDAVGDAATRAAIEVELRLVGLEIGIEPMRLRERTIGIPEELGRLRVRGELAAAWLAWRQGDPHWAQAIDAAAGRIEASDWSQRSLWLLLGALRDGTAGDTAARMLAASAAEHADARLGAQFDRALRFAPPTAKRLAARTRLR